MKMLTASVGAPTIVAVVVVLLLSLISLPGTFSHYRRAGTGYTYRDLRVRGLVHEQASEPAKQEGMKCAILMLLGQHIPISLLVLIAVGLLSKSTTLEFKRALRRLYIVTSGAAIFFFSLGVTYWTANAFPSSLGPALIIYTAISCVLWSTIGIGVAIRGKQRVAPFPLPYGSPAAGPPSGEA